MFAAMVLADLALVKQFLFKGAFIATPRRPPPTPLASPTRLHLPDLPGI